MALMQKYSTEATSKTHGLVDAKLFDIINPNVALDTFGETARLALAGVAGWVGRGYKENRTIGF